MTKEYATPEECAAVTRQATPDENWLANQLDRIDPHRHEIGSAGDRPALERLVFELKAEVERLRKDAERLDYLQKHARCDPKMDGQHMWWPTTLNHANNLRGGTIREAIDAAMKGTP